MAPSASSSPRLASRSRTPAAATGMRFDRAILDPTATESSSSANLPLLPRGNESRGRRTLAKHSITRWKTPEFFVYYAVILVGLPAMFMCAWDFSSEEHPSYRKYAHRLSKGWMLGRQVDNSDSQYASFRNNIPVLLQVGVLHLVLSHLVQRFQPRLRPLFSLAFSLVFLSVIHGASVLKIIAIVMVNFAITASIGTTRLGVVLTWLWSLGALFMNDMYRGYEFAALHPGLGWLDQVNGINMRWWITFNFSTLRMISYSMDYYWMSLGSDKASSEIHRQTCSVCSAAIHPSEQCDTARTRNPHPRNLYSLINYLAYLFYVPLYLAGPIITFNDFVAQLRHAPRDITAKSTLIYALRWAGTVLCMEWLLHTVYVVAIKDTRAWGGFSPFQMSMVGYFNLKLIWLKLLIIWRFFRLWATADLISCPENMTRCMSNNYSCIEFWRSWHRSYNRWMVRYLYIPLGGSKYYALNIWPVFTFVAIWHDISLKLLTWGWLVAGFILPEVAVRKIFATEQWRQRIGATLYRHIAATAGVLNILMMMTANLVGFALGVDGIKEMIGQIWNASGILFLLTTFVCVFSAVQVMFEIRREEERRGIKK